VSDGIPFVMNTGQTNGKDLIFFNCPTNHNLRVGQWVQLNITINGKSLFQVYSLGNGSYRSENNVFSV
jgi:hypothetical protein